jgi:hypothetical protein
LGGEDITGAWQFGDARVGSNWRRPTSTIHTVNAPNPPAGSTELDVASQAVENLVTQFSSSYDFYRELVQNSIDAGSAAIDIWLDFIPDEAGGAGGVIEVHVDDSGEGMTSEIIDDQLTTLFSSSKENDLTKIGKFGIGFVSVFAPNPKGVLVQTGRDGEYWEVFFDHDRSFIKSPLATPVEGTQITLFIEGDRARYSEFVGRSQETIDHWCRHSESEITFEDRASQDGVSVRINKPFSVEGECMTQFEREGTEIVLAYSRTPVWGFYNKGLALAVVRGENDLVPAELRHVTFRIKSRYLEHTLSRETVMRDENYDKAMALVGEAVRGTLRRNLVREIVTLVEAVARASSSTGGRGDNQPVEREASPHGGRRPSTGGFHGREDKRWTARERGRYFELMGYLASEGPDALEACSQEPILLGLDGRAYTLDRICTQAGEDGRVYVDTEVGPMVERLFEQGTPVIMISGEAELIEAGAGKLGPVTRVLANALSREFVSSRVVARMIEQLRGQAKVSAWTRAIELIARPLDVLVGVEVVEDMPEATALVEHAASILARGLGRRGLFARAASLLGGREPVLGYRRVVCARLHGTHAGHDRLFVVAHEIAPMMAVPTERNMLHARGRQPEAAVNCEHAHFRALLRIAAREPQLGAYCLAKALLLDEDRGLEFDVPLMRAAMEPSATGGR